MTYPDIRLWVGGSAATIRGERIDLTGFRCFSAAHSARKIGKFQVDPNEVIALLDSGAFTDPPGKRLQPWSALQRQLEWEITFSEMCGQSWRAESLVSYDLLIDEVWIAGERHKRRWSVAQAEYVRETIEAARYLSARRRDLYPRGLVLACQGVDSTQYAECVHDVLSFCESGDTIGLGGWCILGRMTTWLSEFERTIERIIPMVAQAGISACHIFGVLYEPALAYLLAVADDHRIGISTDSSKPMMAVTWSNPRKAGVRSVEVSARANVNWWINRLATFRQSVTYRHAILKREAKARQFSLPFATV